MADFTATRILYMEDDPALSVLLQKNLERQGFIVEIAANGEEGIAMAGTASYDLLLVDYNMPFLGGIDVLRTLASKGDFPPIIMVTGEGDEAVAVEALKLGAADYIVKDVEMKYLVQLPMVIDRVLYNQQLTTERKHTEQALRESEERYRMLVELSPDGIAVYAEGKFVFMNPAGMRILGAVSSEQVIGVSPLAIVHPDFHDGVIAQIADLENKTDLVPWTEQKFIRFDGAMIDVDVAGVRFTYRGRPAVQTIFRDISERKRVAKRLERLALYDTLTGLPNRTLCFDRLNQLLALARRNQYVLALLFMDLDRFKHINDTHGHEVGDLVLAETARRMTSITRSSDTVARMGGDEFIGICARIAAPADASVVADKIIKALTRPFWMKGIELNLSVSVGISLYPFDGFEVEMLVNKADTAMYRVKENGKGGYRFFSDPDRSTVS